MKNLFKKKAYLEYWFKNPELNDPHVSENIVDKFIEKASPKTCCWWSKLPVLSLGFKNIESYFNALHRDRLCGYTDSPANVPVTAKTCPGIIDLFRNTYLIKAPSDAVITVTPDGGYTVDCADKNWFISDHSQKQFASEDNDFFKGKIALKFNFNIWLRTTNQSALLFTQPIYHSKHPFVIANGMIGPKYAVREELNTIAFIDIPKDEPVTYFINAGDVLSYLVSFDGLEMRPAKQNFFLSFIHEKWRTKNIY